MSDPDTDLGVRSVSMSYSMAHLGYIDSVWMYSSSLRNYLPRPGGAGKFQLLTLGVHFTQWGWLPKHNSQKNTSPFGVSAFVAFAKANASPLRPRD